MRNIIQTIAVLILGIYIHCPSALGQYIPTIQEGHHWTIRQHQGMGSYADYGYALKCDTLIDNKIYLEVRSDDDVLLGWAREDTSTQEVFYWRQGQPSEDRILSYQVEVMDTFWLKGFPLVCDSIKTLDLYGATRKVIYFNGYVAFIEGVGHSFYGIHDFGDFQNIESFVPDSSYCNPVTSWEPQFTPAHYRLYPNPVTGQLTISADNIDIRSVELLNAFGKSCPVSTNALDGDSRLDVTHLPPGVYFLLLNQTELLRFVKI